MPSSSSSPSAQPHPATGADWQDGTGNASHQGWHNGWDNGWLRGAHRCPSPNHGARPQGTALRLVVLHSISLPPGEFGNGCIEQLFTNTLDWDAHPYFETIRGATVSSHFVIDRTGRVTQFVSIWDRAWHAGQSNWRGVDNCNDFSIGIELEGLEGSHFEKPQYEALVQLSAMLLKALPSIEGFAGHEHIAPGRKQDPGAGFDWTRLIGIVDALAPGLNWPPQA